jgi:hypothetical protein
MDSPQPAESRPLPGSDATENCGEIARSANGVLNRIQKEGITKNPFPSLIRNGVSAPPGPYDALSAKEILEDCDFKGMVAKWRSGVKVLAGIRPYCTAIKGRWIIIIYRMR